MRKLMVDINNKKTMATALFSVIFSFTLIFSITFNCDNCIKRWLDGKVILYIILFSAVFLCTLLVITLLCNVNIKFSDNIVNKRNIILYAIPSILICTLYLIGFYPGFMTSDSFDQWSQAHTYVFNDWHPVMHTLFILAITKIYDAPQAVAIVQIVFFSLIVGYGLYSLQKLGINNKILFIISVLIAVFPPNAVMNIALWKDVMYNSSLALFTIVVMNIFFTKGEWIDSRINRIFFILISLAVIFFRHNGIMPLAGTLIFLLCIYRTRIKKYFIMSSIIALIFILVEFPLYHFLKVIPAPSNEAFGIPTQQIAAVVKYNGYLTDEQKQEISKIMPLKEISKNYFAYSTNTLKFQDDFNKSVIEQDKIGFLKLWFNVCLQNPKIVTKAYLEQTSLIWHIDEQLDGGYTYIVSIGIDKNNFNIKNTIINKHITNLCNKIFDLTTTKKIRWIFWRPALPLFIIIISAFVLALKHGKKSLIIISPIILNVLSMCIAIPAQDYRYLHANYLVSLIILLSAMIKKSDKLSESH